MKNPTLLFDLAHNEMLNIESEDFSDFLELLHSLGFKVKTNDNNNLINKVFQNIEVLILGNPIDDYFSSIEIKNIIDFVRSGGRLLIISEYGGDYVQKTNLSDIAGKYFGIFLQKNIVKEYNKINENCSSILHIQNFQSHKITRQLRELVIGGTCSLLLNKNSKPLFFSNNSWTEIYNHSSEQWLRDSKEEQRQTLAAYSEYGRGKVVVLCDIDIFSNDQNIGLNRLDNRKFILNLFNWLIEPIRENDVIEWTLNQLGTMTHEIKNMNNKINNIIETITILEQRISMIEGTKDKSVYKKKMLEKKIY